MSVDIEDFTIDHSAAAVRYDKDVPVNDIYGHFLGLAVRTKRAEVERCGFDAVIDCALGHADVTLPKTNSANGSRLDISVHHWRVVESCRSVSKWRGNIPGEFSSVDDFG